MSVVVDDRKGLALSLMYPDIYWVLVWRCPSPVRFSTGQLIIAHLCISDPKEDSSTRFSNQAPYNLLDSAGCSILYQASAILRKTRYSRRADLGIATRLGATFELCSPHPLHLQIYFPAYFPLTSFQQPPKTTVLSLRTMRPVS